MKRLEALVLFVLLAVVVPSGFAQTCPTPPAGPYYMSGYAWYDYTPDAGCVSGYGGVSSSTMWCFNTPSWTASQGSIGVVTYTFTGDPAMSTNWSADAFMEFADPNGSSLNWIDMWAGVNHNGLTTWTQLYFHDGTDGYLSCDRRGGSFYAEEGDEITIEIYTYRYHSNATVQVARPHIFSGS